MNKKSCYGISSIIVLTEYEKQSMYVYIYGVCPVKVQPLLV